MKYLTLPLFVLGIVVVASVACAQPCQECDLAVTSWDGQNPCACWGSGETLMDNLSIFGGLDGSKEPQDFGVNALFGGRAHVDSGVALSRKHGIGMQLGVGFNYSDHAVQVVERIEGTRERTQVFVTLGVFQRAANDWSWGLVYDYQQSGYYDEFDLGQWRGLVSYQLNPCHEVGVRLAFSDQRDRGSFGAIPVVLDPITQGSIYYRHTWESGADTALWLGLAEGHSESNVALGDLPPLDERFLFGADLHCPLTSQLAIYGEANFIFPADTGTVDAFLGFVFYPGGIKSRRFNRFAPLQPVANNPSMSIDMSR